MRSLIAFLTGLLLGAIFRPLRIDVRRRPPMVRPYRDYRYQTARRTPPAGARVCHVCGSEIPGERRFCTSCGANTPPPPKSGAAPPS